MRFLLSFNFIDLQLLKYTANTFGEVKIVYPPLPLNFTFRNANHVLDKIC